MHKSEYYYHATLARYFMDKPACFDQKNHEQPNVRKLVEQPFQQSMAGMKEEWEVTLMDYEFMQALLVL